MTPTLNNETFEIVKDECQGGNLLKCDEMITMRGGDDSHKKALRACLNQNKGPITLDNGTVISDNSIKFACYRYHATYLDSDDHVRLKTPTNG